MHIARLVAAQSTSVKVAGGAVAFTGGAVLFQCAWTSAEKAWSATPDPLDLLLAHGYRAPGVWWMRGAMMDAVHTGDGPKLRVLLPKLESSFTFFKEWDSLLDKALQSSNQCTDVVDAILTAGMKSKTGNEFSRSRNWLQDQCGRVDWSPIARFLCFHPLMSEKMNNTVAFYAPQTFFKTLIQAALDGDLNARRMLRDFETCEDAELKSVLMGRLALAMTPKQLRDAAVARENTLVPVLAKALLAASKERSLDLGKWDTKGHLWAALETCLSRSAPREDDTVLNLLIDLVKVQHPKDGQVKVLRAAASRSNGFFLESEMAKSSAVDLAFLGEELHRVVGDICNKAHKDVHPKDIDMLAVIMKKILPQGTPSPYVRHPGSHMSPSDVFDLYDVLGKKVCQKMDTTGGVHHVRSFVKWCKSGKDKARVMYTAFQAVLHNCSHHRKGIYAAPLVSYLVSQGEDPWTCLKQILELGSNKLPADAVEVVRCLCKAMATRSTNAGHNHNELLAIAVRTCRDRTDVIQELLNDPSIRSQLEVKKQCNQQESFAVDAAVIALTTSLVGLLTIVFSIASRR
jgi:hypothetical protein